MSQPQQRIPMTPDARRGRAIAQLIPLIFFRLGFMRLWKLIPRSARRRLVDRVLTTKIVRDADRSTKAEPPFLICGLATSNTSFGWALRATEAQLKGQGHEVATLDVSRFLNTGTSDKEPLTSSNTQNFSGRGTAILHFNPNQLNYLLSAVPPQLLSKKYLIEYCAWELEVIPKEWITWSEPVDEVWVPSAFVRDAFVRSGFKKPVRVVPHELIKPTGVTASRERFGLPPKAFVFLTALNIRSGMERKNVGAAIEAFGRAFAHNDNALLVVKTHDDFANPRSMRSINRLVRGRPNIRVVQDDLPEVEMWSLIASADAILSLHRAEGFGLLILQGMMLNKHVVATGWSGNMDFMKGPLAHPVPYRLIPVDDPEGNYAGDLDARWAEPDIDAAARILRELAEGKIS